MTKALFLFPPITSPTYVPLGLASLAAYIRAEAPACCLRVLDLNITAWTSLADREPGGREMMAFMQGKAGDFYDETAYGSHKKTWQRLWKRLHLLGAGAQRYLDKGEADDDFFEFIDRQVAGVLDQEPELIGISVMFFDQLAFALALAKRISRHFTGKPVSASGRARPRPSMILGGAAMASIRADNILRHCDFIDGIVIGEGEAGAAALCRGQAMDTVPELIFRSLNRIHRNRCRRTLSFQHLPPPDYSDFDLSGYFNPEPVLPALFSRGCQWRKCRFCVHHTSFFSYRRKALSVFSAELRNCREKYGARHIYLADQYIVASDLEHLADEFIDSNLNIAFHVMGRPNREHTPERLQKLFQAGCRWICWGTESGSQRLLDLAGKGTRVADIEEVLKNAAECGISNLVMMIFGLPTSSELDLQYTLEFLDRISPFTDAFSSSAFVLWTHSPFGRHKEAYGLSVTGQEVLFQVSGAPLYSLRLKHLERAEDGGLRPSRGPLEISVWEQRRRWIAPHTFLEGLPCEHYLLFSAARRTGRSRSGSDDRPPKLSQSRAA